MTATAVMDKLRRNLEKRDLDNYLFVQASAKAENIAVLRVLAASFAATLDFTLPEIDELKGAISEAVTNVVVHAYPEIKEQGLVSITAGIKDGSVLFVVSDDGIGIDDIDRARDPSYTSKPGEHMGLGFAFMESFMDEVHVESTPSRGTSVYLLKSPAGAGERTGREGAGKPAGH
jgi:stage II sporulation protein AB (anti-sigma F factor)